MRENMTTMVMSYIKEYGSAFDNEDMLDLPNHEEEDENTKKQTKKLKLEQHAVLNIPDTEMTVSKVAMPSVSYSSSSPLTHSYPSQTCYFMHLKILWSLEVGATSLACGRLKKAPD